MTKPYQGAAWVKQLKKQVEARGEKAATGIVNGMIWTANGVGAMINFAPRARCKKASPADP